MLIIAGDTPKRRANSRPDNLLLRTNATFLRVSFAALFLSPFASRLRRRFFLSMSFTLAACVPRNK